MLDRSAQLLSTLLQFIEQADVLDGDDSLVGEGRYQIHLLVGERLHVWTANRDYSDDGPLTKHRDREDGAMHLLLSRLILGPLILGIRQDVRNVNHPTLQCRSSGG